MSNYLSITIGPITKTMQLAQKTREFWGASMMFSLISKFICEALKKQGVKEVDFLLPSQKNFSRGMKNIGLYADRIICEAPVMVWENFDKSILDVAFKNLSVELQKVVGTSGLTKEMLKSYFKIYAVYEPQSSNGIAYDIFNHLNVLELYNTGASSASTTKELKVFLENVNTKYEREDEAEDLENSFVASNFINDYTDQTLNDLNGKQRIPSIVEISTKPLQNKKANDEKNTYKQILNRNIWKNLPNEDKLFEELKQNFSNDVKNYHRYICILQADGDSLGKYVSERKVANKLIDIQDALFNWGTTALTILQNYEALPIFIGGDDLMCFAPVNNGDENIIDLAKKINEAYCNDPVLKKANSTLSIGIKIAYYKAPMGESYSDTFPLLKGVAKKHNYKGKTANSCAISFEKHSGQPHQFVFNFNNEYVSFIEPIINNMEENNQKRSFINSVLYKIRANEQLLWLASNNGIDNLWYFFENNFEEAKPKRKGTKPYQYLKGIANYLKYLFDTYKNTTINNRHQELKATNHLYSALKIFRFIKGLDYDN